MQQQQEQHLIPCIRVHFEKLTVTQLVKNFPAFYGTRWKFIMFTRACHWSPLSARCIQCTTICHISLRSILILSFHPRLGLPNSIFPWGLPYQNFVWIFLPFALHTNMVNINTYVELHIHGEARHYLHSNARSERSYCKASKKPSGSQVSLNIYKPCSLVLKWACISGHCKKPSFTPCSTSGKITV